MSKKLLMNNYSDNGLTPIQDGLVCWLDAFDLTSYTVDEEWRDRTSYSNNGIIRTVNNLQSVNNGILHAQSVVDIPNPTKNLSSYSVEIGYQDLKNGYWFGLWGNRSNNTGISFYQTSGVYKTYPALSTPSTSKDAVIGGKNYLVFTFNSSSLKIYHNGELYYNHSLSNNNILPSTAKYLCFMARKVNTTNDDAEGGVDQKLAKWYYIRIYNKTLTDNEVINNYNYERSLQRG